MDQWSSSGSLVATPGCKPVVSGSNPAISQASSGLPLLDGLPSGMVLHCRLSSKWQERKINSKEGFWYTKNNKPISDK
jgi:hypothetical protein